MLRAATRRGRYRRGVSADPDVSAPAIPEDEEPRLDALRATDLLDTPKEERFDRITRLLGRVLGVPISIINFIDADRQWSKSCVGVPSADAPRVSSFCAHAILGEAPLIVPDTLRDRRFAKNPMVLGEPFVRAYAGQPVHDPRGYRIGTLCAADREPRDWSDGDLRTLFALAKWVELELGADGLRRRAEAAEARLRELRDAPGAA